LIGADLISITAYEKVLPSCCWTFNVVDDDAATQDAAGQGFPREL
jgi:hypothetical protein